MASLLGRGELPSAVRELKRGFAQEQALLRLVHIDARMLRVLFRGQHPERSAFHDPLVILTGMNAVYRQLESPPPFNPTVAQRVIAAPLRDDSFNLSRKREWTRLIGLLQVDRRFRRPPSALRRQHHLARTAPHELPRAVDLTVRRLRQRETSR